MLLQHQIKETKIPNDVEAFGVFHWSFIVWRGIWKYSFGKNQRLYLELLISMFEKYVQFTFDLKIQLF